MVKTIEQAEAAVLLAAIEYAVANKLYAEAWERNGEMARFAASTSARPSLHPETAALCRASVDKMDALCAAARDLKDTVERQPQATVSP